MCIYTYVIHPSLPHPLIKAFTPICTSNIKHLIFIVFDAAPNEYHLHSKVIQAPFLNTGICVSESSGPVPLEAQFSCYYSYWQRAFKSTSSFRSLYSWKLIFIRNCPFQLLQFATKISFGNTVKPVYNDHLMGYFSAFWSSSRWPRAT